MRRVVVTGLGFVTSIGNDKSTVLTNLRELRHGITLFPEFQEDNTPVKVAATIKGFNSKSNCSSNLFNRSGRNRKDRYSLFER